MTTNTVNWIPPATFERWTMYQRIVGEWKPTTIYVGTATCQTREGAEIHFREHHPFAGKIRAVLETVTADSVTPDFDADHASCAPSLGTSRKEAGRV